MIEFLPTAKQIGKIVAEFQAKSRMTETFKAWKISLIRFKARYRRHVKPVLIWDFFHRQKNLGSSHVFAGHQEKNLNLQVAESVHFSIELSFSKLLQMLYLICLIVQTSNPEEKFQNCQNFALSQTNNSLSLIDIGKCKHLIDENVKSGLLQCCINRKLFIFVIQIWCIRNDYYLE